MAPPPLDPTELFATSLSAFLMASATGKDLVPFGNAIMSHLSETLPQKRPATVNEMSFGKEGQRKEFPPPHPKFNVYPPSPLTHSLEETFARELFCEKSR